MPRPPESSPAEGVDAPRAVLDASALLAYMHDEDGALKVRETMKRGCAIGLVNLAEVLSKIAEDGGSPESTLEELRKFDPALKIIPPTEDDAVAIARLRPKTKDAGLSLGDRACIALAERLGAPAMTADREWARADLDIEVVQIRGDEE